MIKTSKERLRTLEKIQTLWGERKKKHILKRSIWSRLSVKEKQALKVNGYVT